MRTSPFLTVRWLPSAAPEKNVNHRQNDKNFTILVSCAPFTDPTHITNHHDPLVPASHLPGLRLLRRLRRAHSLWHGIAVTGRHHPRYRRHHL